MLLPYKPINIDYICRICLIDYFCKSLLEIMPSLYIINFLITFAVKINCNRSVTEIKAVTFNIIVFQYTSLHLEVPFSQIPFLILPRRLRKTIFTRLVIIVNDSRSRQSPEAGSHSGIPPLCLSSSYSDSCVFPRITVWTLHAYERGGRTLTQPQIVYICPLGLVYFLTQLCVHMMANKNPLHCEIVISFLSFFSVSVDATFWRYLSFVMSVLGKWVSLRCPLLWQFAVDSLLDKLEPWSQ